MTKILGFCFALALLATPGLAHASNWAGLSLGPNFSSLTNLPDNLGGETTFHIEGDLDYEVKQMPMMYIHTALRYNGYGFTLNNSDASYTAHYLEIPVLAKPNFDIGYGVHVYGLIGPMIGFKISQGAEQDGQDIDANFANTFDFSWDFGIGTQYSVMDNVRVFAEFEYDLGLIDVARGAQDSKTRGPMLTFGAMMAF